MPFPEPDLIIKLIRRHAHDVRNHCSGIDLDATLLGELAADSEVATIADRLRNHVSRIDTELKFLLLKLEESRPVTVTAGDLLQLWRMKLQPLAGAGHEIVWPDAAPAPSVTLDSRLIVQVLCDLTMRAWARNPRMPLQAGVRMDPEHLFLDLREPPLGPPPNADYQGETAALLSAKGLQLHWLLVEPDQQWTTTLAIPLTGA